MRAVVSYILITAFAASLCAQKKNRIDSLERLLSTKQYNDSSLIDILSGLVYEVSRKDFEKARAYSGRLLEHSKKIKSEKGIGLAYNSLGLAYSSAARYDSAIYYYSLAAGIREKMKDSTAWATTLNNLGSVYFYKNDLPKMLEYYQRACRIREAQGNETAMANSYIGIGNVYGMMQQPDKSFEYFSKALKIQEKKDDLYGMSSSLSNIGVLYLQKKDFKKAIEYTERALKVREKINSPDLIAGAHKNLAGIYTEAGDLPNAKKQFELCLKVFREQGDKYNEADVYVNMGDMEYKLGHYRDAAGVFTKGAALSRGIGNKAFLERCYDGLSACWYMLRDYEKAYDYQKRRAGLKDSIYSESNANAIAEMNTRFETEKKDKELLQKNAALEKEQAEARQQAFQRNIFIAGFVIVLLAGIFIFRSLKQNQKARRIISMQKKEVEEQHTLIAEKNASLSEAFAIIEEKNKDITDSINYARRIQRSILPTQEELKEGLGEHFVLYMPKDIVSGDFYWLSVVSTSATTLREKLSVVAAVDCTGHGVPGALMSIIGCTLLNQTIKNPNINSPAEALNYLNHELPKNLKAQTKGEVIRDGMDMTMCAISWEKKKLYFAGANNPIYIIRNGTLTELKGDKQPVSGSAVDEKKDFTNQAFMLEPGDAIYMFTDGYADQFGGPKGKKFKYSQLEQVLTGVSSRPMEEQAKILEETFEGWKGELEQIDDVLIIGIRV